MPDSYNFFKEIYVILFGLKKTKDANLNWDYNEFTTELKNSLTNVLSVVTNNFETNAPRAIAFSCKSAEITHAIISKMILQTFYREGDLDVDFIILSIFLTNMALGFFNIRPIEKTEQAASFVHAADLIGALAYDDELRQESAKQLFYEFSAEQKFAGGLGFLGFQGEGKGKEYSMPKSLWVKEQLSFIGMILGELTHAKLLKDKIHGSVAEASKFFYAGPTPFEAQIKKVIDIYLSVCDHACAKDFSPFAFINFYGNPVSDSNYKTVGEGLYSHAHKGYELAKSKNSYLRI